MAAATAMAIAGLATTALGAGMQIYTQRQQQKSQQRLAEYNNQLVQNQAKQLENEHAEATNRAQANKKKQLSAIRSSLASSGLNTQSGNSLSFLSETASNFQMGIMDAARSANAASANARLEGRNALWSASQKSPWSMAGTILQASSSIGQSYLGHVKSGALSDPLNLFKNKQTF